MSGSPSANVYIQPSGEVSLVCTHDQMFSPPYCFVGASFPQSSVPYPALRGASLAIGAACAKQGIVGYVGIDFVALQSEEGLKLLAVDLNIRYTDTLAAFHMFHFLMGGVYDQGSSGKYYVDKRPGVVLVSDHHSHASATTQLRTISPHGDTEHADTDCAYFRCPRRFCGPHVPQRAGGGQRDALGCCRCTTCFWWSPAATNEAHS